jgi:lipopolysaccharide export system protein LptC
VFRGVDAGYGTKSDPTMNRLVAAQADEQTARAYWTMGRNDAERSFRAATKHSRRVRRLRVAMPALVIFFLAASILWSWLNPLAMLDALPIKLGDTVISGTKIKMEAPRLTGFTKDARAYEMTAKSAAQDLTKPDMVELTDIHAKLQARDTSETNLTARNGLYDSKKEILTLGDDVIITTSGYKAWLSDAVVDVKTSNVVSNKAVKVQMLKGLLDANGVKISESGDLITFDGGVKMDMKLESIKPPAQSEAAPR